MNRRISFLAGEVIRQADRDRPADALLRQVIREDRRITPDQAREISEAVFAFYRWRGWLSEDYPLAQQIVYAAKLQADFLSGERVLSDENLSRRTVPEWVGKELKVTLPWLKALQSPSKLWLRCRPGTREAVAEELGNCERVPEPADALVYTGSKDLFQTSGFRGGRFELQDVNSQRVGFTANPQPGETWWDACAGEGGKTMHLSDLMQNKGLIWASDRAEWRLKKLKQRASRAGVFNYRTVPWDGGERPPTKTRFDGILIDAPCTGMGTWQRNPHARWTTTVEDVAELATAQLALLMHAAPSLKPGGRLVYAVCTLTRRETVDVASRFERHAEGFERLVASGTDKGYLWPQNTGGNGMFIAVWRKKA
ncbi:MAG TPA: RNA methyltransferase [Verrucomicrobiales bacterium]|nr:RNA methyltransferase [Verrucomicrobiales bacterium]